MRNVYIAFEYQSHVWLMITYTLGNIYFVYSPLPQSSLCCKRLVHTVAAEEDKTLSATTTTVADSPKLRWE